MKIPYGISDFKALREQGYLYVDKTQYIEKLENLNSKYVFFIRPRRFGKSLFLSTLEQYYDKNAKDTFESLFDDLYIGQNPTPLKNGYLVLRLNFSGLSTQNKESILQSFNNRVVLNISTFIKKYQNFIPEFLNLIDKVNVCNDAISAIDLLINSLKETTTKIYLIIDEYDNFANDIIAMGDGVLYKDIVRGSGFVREFYKTVKIGTESVIDRIFITGISPIMLDDLTSGFNIAMNITLDESLNEIMGFTSEELQSIISRLDIKQENIQVKLKEYYNGYLFNIDCTKRVYNPDMVLFYFDKLVRFGKPPRELIDENLKTDYGRLERLISNEDNRVMLEKIIKEENITTSIITKFSFDRMYDSDYFVSLLFYMGLLTIKGEKYGKTELTIPNYVIRTIFWEHFEKILRQKYNIKYDTEDLAKSIWQASFEGTIKPFIEFVSKNVFKHISNRDLIRFDEKYIKMMLLPYLTNSDIYKPVSEKEVENGYIDMYLERDIRKPDVKYEWMLELKYIKKKDVSMLEQVKEVGLNQLNRYAASRSISGREDIKQALIIFIGKDKVIVIDN